MSDWRHPGERAELVERVVKAEKLVRIAQSQARAAIPDEARDEITRLAVRVVELEDIVARLNAKLAERNQRRKAS